MTKVTVSEDQLQDNDIRNFLKYCKEIIGYTKPAKIRIYDDHAVSKEMKSMACFFPKTEEIWVLRGHRVTADWYRSLAHELVHQRQRENGIEMDGSDGSEIENEANSVAAVILREYGRRDPNIYNQSQSIDESLYPNLDIINTKMLTDKGILNHDDKDYSTWPDYKKALAWILESTKAADREIDSNLYSAALFHIKEVSELASDLIQAIEKAKHQHDSSED